jgi:hypothetical protein
MKLKYFVLLSAVEAHKTGVGGMFTISPFLILPVSSQMRRRD